VAPTPTSPDPLPPPGGSPQPPPGPSAPPTVGGLFLASVLDAYWAAEPAGTPLAVDAGGEP
jgi:hypothetical protein